jgi:signal transduction histidine kinase/ActR/RegA family two-component response regulator
MGAQFDFANQELEISKLKTDTLEKEVQLARTRAQQRTIIFSAAILLVLVGVTGGSIHYRSVVRSRNEIRKKNDELSQSNLFLEKALKAKSEFLATTSHEIRTPLNGILGTTQVLIHSARMPEEVRERVELIQIAGEAMKGIVDDLLDVAKMESGTIEVADECFNLQTALSEVSRFWADSAANKGLILAAELEASPSFIMGDEKRLRQIVYNLLSNAVKFTDEGRVSLCAEVDVENDGALVIKVSDTGCGIPEDELDRIFAPFHQVDGGKTRRHGGTGLGLSICQNLAAALGGTVSVSSRLSEGSTFVLRLPLRLAEGAGRSLDGAMAETVSGLNLSRLLIVSDDAGVSASLQIPLAMRDLDFELVDSMAEALSAMADRPVSALLVTASVFGSDPGEAMERLMEFRELSGEVRLIVWLDEASLLTAPMVRLCGADDVLEGDFDPEGALACVLNESPLATEYQGIDVRPNGTVGA